MFTRSHVYLLRLFLFVVEKETEDLIANFETLDVVRRCHYRASRSITQTLRELRHQTCVNLVYI